MTGKQRMGLGFWRVRRIVWLATLLLAMSTHATPGARAAGGALDPSFGQGGRVLAEAGAFNAVQLLDGRLVVAGTDGADVLVARFLPDGALDPSFGGDGMVTTDAGGEGDVAHALAITATGGVAVAGTNGDDFVLVRYQEDGGLDPTFGEGGIVTTEVSKERQVSPGSSDADGQIVEVGGQPDVATSLVALPDGRLVAAGRAGGLALADADTDLALARYTTDGSLDATFGADGVVFTDVGYQETATSVVLVGNSYVVGGSGFFPRQQTRDVILARYTDSGLLDPAFGPGGVVRTDLGGDERGEDVGVLPDGRLVVAGRKAGDVAVIRFTPNGGIDGTFGPSGNGVVVTNLGGSNDTGHAVAFDQDKIVVAGTRNGEDVALVRYTAAGAVDPTFGSDGVVITDFAADMQDIAAALAIDANGTAVVAGSSKAPGRPEQDTAFVARYLTRDGHSSPAPPRIVSVQGDEESPASGIDPTPEVTVTGVRFGHVVKILDGGTEVASTTADGGTVTFNEEAGDRSVVFEDERAHSLTTVAVDEAGRQSPSSAPFLYMLRSTETDEVPKILALEPPAGPTPGGNAVTVRGSGLAARAVRVQFGHADALEVTVISDSELVATAPPQPQTVVDVTVTTANGRSPVVPEARYAYGAGSWTDGGPPSSCGDGCGARSLHTATLLGDGSVLLAGGSPDFFVQRNDRGEPFTRALASSQRHVAGQWRAAGTLGEARFLHTATLLDPPACRDGTAEAGYPCGAVLVAGGQTELATATRSAELYDQASDRWRPTADLGVPRFAHTATLLDDGRVIVVGGVVTEPERGLTPLAAAEVYDPVSGVWTPTTPLIPARANHTATRLGDGKVLVAGGLTGYNGQGGQPYHATTTASSSIYDPRTGTWTTASSLAMARFDHTATLLEGPACIRAPAMCGKVVVAGGDAGGAQYLASSELFDPVTGEWWPSGLLDTARGGHTAVSLANGTVLVAGGGPRFPAAPDPPKERAIRSASLFDPSTSTWQPTSAMASRRGGHTATSLPSGQVLVAAGYRALLAHGVSSTPTDTSELYRPAPSLRSLKPLIIPEGRATSVEVEGSGFDTLASAALSPVEVGGTREDVSLAVGHTVVTDSLATVRLPAMHAGVFTLSLVNDGGTSLSRPSRPAHRLIVKGAPGTPVVEARALSASSVLLEFPAVDDGAGAIPARTYVVQQSPEGGVEGVLLCGGRCRFSPTAVGVALQLRVDDLAPGTTYRYAVTAENDVGLLGHTGYVSVRTLPLEGICPVGPIEGNVRYPGGQFSLVGLPGGTQVNGDSPLYQWLDRGAGASYDMTASSEPVKAGHGYWAWFRCSRLVAAGPGESRAVLSLGGYHASMVGNPSGRAEASVSGHDYAARWHPESSSYELSGYRQDLRLAVGEGSWVFSYEPTRVRIEAVG